MAYLLYKRTWTFLDVQLILLMSFIVLIKINQLQKLYDKEIRLLRLPCCVDCSTLADIWRMHVPFLCEKP